MPPFKNAEEANLFPPGLLSEAFVGIIMQIFFAPR